MRIGFNALLLGTGENYRRTGVSRYIDRLGRELAERLPPDDFIVFAQCDFSSNTYRPWWRVDRPAARIAWESTGLPLQIRRRKLDLFHGTVNVLPRGLSCRSVLTIHDLAFLRWPDHVPARRLRYLSKAVPSAANRADRILVPSEATKVDIVELLGVDPNRIAVTPLGVDERFRPASIETIADLRSRLALDGPFILFLGTLEPRKNLETLVRAFASIEAVIPHTLVLAGPEGWLTSQLHDLVGSLVKSGRVRIPGFVSESDLPALYSAADLFAFPSRYEGFGLPVLEAMACGTPVLTSSTSSLPEIAADAALLVDPLDLETLAAALSELATDQPLRAQLRQHGLARARAFSWSKTADLTIAAYREALA